MLLRPILSRIHNKHQRFASFCILNNGESSILSAENATSPSEKSPEKGYVVSYLVNSCGLSPKQAFSASKLVHFDGPDKPNAVLDFLEKRGFSKTQIAKMVKKMPNVLLSNPEKSLLPKIEFFLGRTSISETDVFRIVSNNPYLLRRCLEQKFAPVYDYIKDIIGVENVDNLLRRKSWIFMVDLENRLIPNVDFLRELGVPQRCIQLGLFNYPEIFCQKQVEFRKIAGDVKGMGFNPLKSVFIMAIHARNVALWDQCSEVYSKWGWSKDDILTAFRKHPSCMLMPERKISAALDFLVNKIGRDPISVASCPQILFYSMEKTIVPRCSVVHLLSLEGLVEKDWSLTSVLCPTEEKFVEIYVRRYSEELPQLYDIYLSKKGKGVEA